MLFIILPKYIVCRTWCGHNKHKFSIDCPHSAHTNQRKSNGNCLLSQKL